MFLPWPGFSVNGEAVSYTRKCLLRSTFPDHGLGLSCANVSTFSGWTWNYLTPKLVELDCRSNTVLLFSTQRCLLYNGKREGLVWIVELCSE